MTWSPREINLIVLLILPAADVSDWFQFHFNPEPISASFALDLISSQYNTIVYFPRFTLTRGARWLACSRPFTHQLITSVGNQKLLHDKMWQLSEASQSLEDPRWKAFNLLSTDGAGSAPGDLRALLESQSSVSQSEAAAEWGAWHQCWYHEGPMSISSGNCPGGIKWPLCYLRLVEPFPNLAQRYFTKLKTS